MLSGQIPSVNRIKKGINDGMVNCKWFLTEGEEKPREISMFWKKGKKEKRKEKKRQAWESVDLEWQEQERGLYL